MASLKICFAKLIGLLNHGSKAYSIMILLKNSLPNLGEFFLVLVISMGALLPLSAATSRKVQLETFHVSKADMTHFSSNGQLIK